MDGDAYRPGPDGVSPMFAMFMRDNESRFAECPPDEIATMCSMIILACNDAERKGALTKPAADQIRARMTARGGSMPGNDAAAETRGELRERARIIKWMRNLRSSLHPVALQIERGAHLT